MQSIWKIMAVLTLAGFTAAGCTSIDEVSQMKPKGGAYEKGLYAGYMKLAKGEYDEDDIADAEWFAQRAKAAASGKPTGPQELSERRLKGSHAKELGPARARLWSALDQGAAKKAGKHAAAAQVAFDCWIQEAEEDIQRIDISRCQIGFNAAMAQVDAAMKEKKMAAPAPAKPAPSKESHIIYFAHDSATLASSTAVIIRDAVASIKKGAKATFVIGHTDASGSDAYNQKLADRRANAVIAELKKAGVTSGISKVVAGERDPKVKTKDGERKGVNRRVEIAILR